MADTTKKAASEKLTKADLIAEKDRVIVSAAREQFLSDGFAGASMDTIARRAGVSVKTIYSHFANKDELFSKVMIGACTDNLFAEEVLSEETLAKRFGWFSRATQRGMFEAGREYLVHLLSDEQLSLYRAITRDAHRFPALGSQYQLNIARGRTKLLEMYLKSVTRNKCWTGRDAAQDAVTYEGLLRAGIFEEALHGLLDATSDVIERHAAAASKTMWRLITAARV